MKKYINGIYVDMTQEEIQQAEQAQAEWERKEKTRPRTEYEGIIALCKSVLQQKITETDDKTIGIACMALFSVYEQNKYHEVGEVATHLETGYPYECMTAYDGSVQQDWTIDNRTLWKPWHSRKKEYALPWEQPTGAHDMYKAGEYMIWTDGTVKKCIQDTNFSPDEYHQAWEDAS